MSFKVPEPPPVDPAEIDPLGVPATPYMSELEGHPHVRKLRREIARLREAGLAMLALNRDMTNRDLVVRRMLEPLNPAPTGTISPVAGAQTLVHVDNLRIISNRALGRNDPTIRILAGGPDAAPMHAHWIRLAASELRQQPRSLPGRTGAFTVLHTAEPLEVLL